MFSLSNFVSNRNAFPVSSVAPSIQEFVENILDHSLPECLLSSMKNNGFDMVIQNDVTKYEIPNISSFIANNLSQALNKSLRQSVLSFSNDLSQVIFPIDSALIQYLPGEMSSDVFDEEDFEFDSSTIFTMDSLSCLSSFCKSERPRIDSEYKLPHFQLELPLLDDLGTNKCLIRLIAFRPINNDHFVNQAILLAMSDIGDKLNFTNTSIFSLNCIDLIGVKIISTNDDLPLSPSKHEMLLIRNMIDRAFNDSLDACIKKCLKFEDRSVLASDRDLDELIQSDDEIIQFTHHDDNLIQNISSGLIRLQGAKSGTRNNNERELDSCLGQIFLSEVFSFEFNDLFDKKHSVLTCLDNFCWPDKTADEMIRNEAVSLLVKEISESFSIEERRSLLRNKMDLLQIRQPNVVASDEFNSLLIGALSSMLDSILNNSIQSALTDQTNSFEIGAISLQDDLFDSSDFEFNVFSSFLSSISQPICILNDFQHHQKMPVVNLNLDFDVNLSAFDGKMSYQSLMNSVMKINEISPNQDTVFDISVSKTLSALSQNLRTEFLDELKVCPDILSTRHQSLELHQESSSEEEEVDFISEQVNESVQIHLDNLFTEALNKSLAESLHANFGGQIISAPTAEDTEIEIPLDNLYEVDFDRNLKENLGLKSIQDSIQNLRCFCNNSHAKELSNSPQIDFAMIQVVQLAEPKVGGMISIQIKNLIQFFTTLNLHHQSIQFDCDSIYNGAVDSFEEELSNSIDSSFSNFLGNVFQHSQFVIFNFSCVPSSSLLNLNLFLQLDKEMSDMLSNCLNKILSPSNFVISKNDKTGEKYLMPYLFDMANSLTITNSVVNYTTEFISSKLDQCLLKALNTD